MKSKLFANTLEIDLARRTFGNNAISQLIASVTGTSLVALNPFDESGSRYVLVYEPERELVYAIHYSYQTFNHVGWESGGLEILVDLDNAGLMPDLSFLKSKVSWARRLYDAASQAKTEIAYVQDGNYATYRGVAVILEHIWCAKDVLHVVHLSRGAWMSQLKETGMKSLALMLANGELEDAPEYVRERAQWVVRQMAIRLELLVQFEATKFANQLGMPQGVSEFQAELKFTLEDGTVLVYNDQTTVSSLERDFIVS